MHDNLDADVKHRRKLYEMELEKWYEDQRQARLASERLEEAQSTGKRAIDIKRYRKEQEHRALEKEQDAAAALAQAATDAKVEAWLEDWGAKADAASAAEHERLLGVMNSKAYDVTPADKKERKAVLHEIKLQAKDVLARADVRSTKKTCNWSNKSVHACFLLFLILFDGSCHRLWHRSVYVCGCSRQCEYS